jgi:YggT family protein
VNTIFLLLSYALTAFQLVLLARVLMTWIPNLDYRNPIVRFLINVTEPILEPVRRLLPSTGGMDFSPLVVFIVIALFSQVLSRMF